MTADLTPNTIKLKPNTRRILDLTIPRWMLELKMNNFNIAKMPKTEQYQMEHEADCCFIGELHGGDGSYDNCGICNALSQFAPWVFQSPNKHITKETTLAAVYTASGFWGKKQFNPTPRGLKIYLNFIAKHIAESHDHLISNGNKREWLMAQEKLIEGSN